MAELKRVLGFKVILLITINSIIGSGLFFLPAIGAEYAGPASIIAWIILSVISIYVAMCFAELVSMFPKAGGIYEFSKQAYGRFWSFIIGWIAWLVGNITTAMLIVGAIQYILPYSTPFFIVSKMFISVAMVIIFNIMAYRGMKTSAFMLVTFAVITLSLIFILIIPSLFHLSPSNLSPFFIYDTTFRNIAFVFLTLFFISEAFFGLESVTFLAEETKKPEKILPKALIWATVIIAVLTIILVTVSLGVLNYQKFGTAEAPFADVAKILFGPVGENIITLGTYLVIIGAAAGWVVTGPRLILALTRDKLFPPYFKDIHKEYSTPYKAILFQMAATSIFIILSFRGEGYKTLLSLLIPLVLIMMGAAIFTVTVLRITKPKIKRYFKTPFGKTGPAIIVLIYIFLITIWLLREENAFHLLRLGLYFVLIGIPIYFLLEMYYNPRAVRKTNNILAYLALFTERIALPLSVRKEILKLLGKVKGRTILEFGCSVGTMTLHLAEEVGKKGRIYATDISERDLLIAQNRMKKKGHSHVRLIHDLKHHSRLHPNIPNIHLVVSVGMLGYLQNVKKVLKEMNKKLKKGSNICFVDYDKFFDVIPNKDWLSNDKRIKRVFKECGFEVKVKRKQGFAWKYIYIYGEKVRNVR